MRRAWASKELSDAEIWVSSSEVRALVEDVKVVWRVEIWVERLEREEMAVVREESEERSE